MIQWGTHKYCNIRYYNAAASIGVQQIQAVDHHELMYYDEVVVVNQ